MTPTVAVRPRWYHRCRGPSFSPFSPLLHYHYQLRLSLHVSSHRRPLSNSRRSLYKRIPHPHTNHPGQASAHSCSFTAPCAWIVRPHGTVTYRYSAIPGSGHFNGRALRSAATAPGSQGCCGRVPDWLLLLLATSRPLMTSWFVS
ncbi:hypothetical protein BV20DRAFT_359408 [Pilatotrama ljubarskyi]|nr:hypothetical protein BV20DRAFT_359408 [Pilatotrama ljubarskyi]